MKKPDRIYEPHLILKEVDLAPGAEWTPPWPGWSLIQMARGTGYWLQPQSSRELDTGAVILASGQAQGRIRATQLGGVNLQAFTVIPARLTGLITWGEQDFLQTAAARKEPSFRILPANSPVATKMKALLCGGRNGAGLLFRLNLLQLFAEAFDGELAQARSDWDTADARERLRVFLERTPPAELLEMSFEDLARTTHCTARHLSRIFRELVGLSFREKRAELRLIRARELLATSESKVVEVALESGYKSLSLFNLMFTRRFGTSPGRWRQAHRSNGDAGFTRPKKLRVPAENPRRFAHAGAV